jgi:hypothetical protein
MEMEEQELIDDPECLGCQCRNKTPAFLPVLPIRAAISLGGDAVGTLQ